MVYTYLIRSKKYNLFYCGISKNPENRLRQHNIGSSGYTARFRPWELVYKKSHISYKEARKHEEWLKKKSRKYKESLFSD